METIFGASMVAAIAVPTISTGLYASRSIWSNIGPPRISLIFEFLGKNYVEYPINLIPISVVGGEEDF